MSKKHWLLMAACCLIPIALILAITVFAIPVSSITTLVIALICPLMMLFMMRGMGHDHAQRHEDTSAEVERRPQPRHARYQRLWHFYDVMETMPERRFQPWRQKLWSLVRGPHMLEVGVGTGKNMPYWPREGNIFDTLQILGEEARVSNSSSNFVKHVTITTPDGSSIKKPTFYRRESLENWRNATPSILSEN